MAIDADLVDELTEAELPITVRAKLEVPGTAGSDAAGFDVVLVARWLGQCCAHQARPIWRRLAQWSQT